MAGKPAYWFLVLLFGADIPSGVVIGRDLVLAHHALGVVIHPLTVIGDRVAIWHGVTLGRSDFFTPMSDSEFEGFVIEDDVYIGAGAKILGGRGVLRIGRGTVVGANSVLMESTGEWEIWAGVPARLVGHRLPLS